MVTTKNKIGNWGKVLIKTLSYLPFMLHRPNLNLALFILCFLTNISIGYTQDLDFTLRYNTADNQYEVFGRANNSQPNFFVGGGSQLSIVLPETVPNSPLIINTVAGGLWTDNSQIFAPAATPNVDYHGIASNGSFMDWVFGEEILLFTFNIPNQTCLDGIRLFDNDNDPNSSEPSMNGGDFQNYFANAFTFLDHYRSNYNNIGTSCNGPSIFVNPITTPINTNGQSCGTIVNVNPNATHTATICQPANNGTTTVNVDNTTNQLCLNFTPNTDFTGQDSVCVEVCDDNNVCVQSMVLLNVIGGGGGNNCANLSQPIVTTNSPICAGDLIELQTTDAGIDFTYTWTNANNETIGQGATLNIASNNNQAIPPFKVTQTTNNCPTLTSLPVNVDIVNFSALTIENNGPICTGSAVELKANGLGSGTYRWFFAGTNTQIATGATTSINNLQETTTFRLEVTINGCQNTNVLETTVIVDPKPNISNLERTITVCRGEDVNITPTNEPATGEEIRYIWKGPNDFLFKNNTTDDQFPLILEDISPDQAGAYSIDITSENGCEIDSRSIIINVVDELETPNLTASETLICSGNTLEITATEQNDANIAFEWFIQTQDTLSLIATSNQPTFSIENATNEHAGKYLVRTTKNGCVSGFSNTITITIFDIVSSVEATNNGPVCPGESVQLSASAIPDAVYNWYTDGNLVATGQTVTIPSITATTIFDLVVSLNSCQNESTAQTTVNIASKPTITNLSEAASFCVGTEVVLSAKNNSALGQAINFSWTGPNNFNYTGITTTDSFVLVIPNITPEKAGSYNLTISSQGCETATRSILVTVNDALVAPSLLAANNLVCGGNSIELTASLQDDANVQFEWYLQLEEGELFLLDITNVPSIIIEQPTTANSGKYLVRTKNGDCISGFSNIETITVLDETSNLSAVNSSNLNNPLCVGDFVQLSVPFFEGATYKWFGPADFTSDSYNPVINSVSGLNGGNYFAIISIDGCTGIVSNPTTVYVNDFEKVPTISGTTILCEGEDLILEIMEGITPDNDEPPTVIWYNANNNQPLDTTNDNRLQIPNASAANSGNYFAVISNRGCQSNPSNSIEVTVVNRTNLVAYAGKDEILCTANTFNLEALAVENATGNWTSPTGAIIDDPTAATTTASNLTKGENLFIWTINDVCRQTATDTLFITVLQTGGDVSNAGADQNICEARTINLNATALEESTGLWSQSLDQFNQGVSFTNPNDPNTAVNGLTPGNSYQFTWTLSTNNCPDFASDGVIITINEEPEEIAFIAEENANISICEGTQAALIAETPLFSTGRWTTTSDVQIVNPTLAETMVGNLTPGEHVFIWTLSNEACTNFSSDTVSIYKEAELLANPDGYTLGLDDSITFNLLDNDVFNNFENLRLTITKFPEKGTLREDGDGQFTFFSTRTDFGADDFRYKLCSNFCESVCDTAIVDLTIQGFGAGNDCFIPNVLSPNGDNVNDQFLVGCIDQFPETSIKIFNRWGDIVHEAAPYLNDWEGTHEGKPLPAGTYFYSLQLSPSSTPIQDFITIFR